MFGEVKGEIENDNGVLVIRRIDVQYRLRVAPEHHEAVERVRAVHADGCPVARTLKGCVTITTEVTLEP